MQFEDFKKGDVFESPGEVVVREKVIQYMELFRGYADILEEYNDPEKAHLPFRKVVVPGGFTASTRAAEVLRIIRQNKVEGERLPLHAHIEGDFDGTVEPGDQLYVRLVVKEVDIGGRNWGRVTFEANCYKRGCGKVVYPGEESFRIRKRKRG